MKAMKNGEIKELERAILEIRINLLRLCNKEAIHIGGDLSIADIMAVLWLKQMKYNVKDPMDELNDRFVLSKGHASAVMSFCQAAIGCFAVEDVFSEYATDEGRFSMHSCNLVNPYVRISTGSLGHGMPIACGIAAGLRLKGNLNSRVYTILGDGELSEGSIWEAAMNAENYHLGNLVAIIDHNGIEADGLVSEITGLGDITQKFKAFGWNVMEINGNNVVEIQDAFNSLPEPTCQKPTCIVAHTIKGKGVSFMENQVRWHAGKITEEQLERAIYEIQQAYERKWAE